MFAFYDVCLKKIILRLWLRPIGKGRSLSGLNIQLWPKVKIVPTVQHCQIIITGSQSSAAATIFYAEKLTLLCDNDKNNYRASFKRALAVIGTNSLSIPNW